MDSQKTSVTTKEKFSEEAWKAIIFSIVEKYKPGELIEHDYLKNIADIQFPQYEDYDTSEDFKKAIDEYSFQYMNFIDKLRWDILEDFKLYLKNVKGEGYIFIPSNEQTDYAKKTAMRDINRTISTTIDIMLNVKHSELDMNEKRKNADELAKMAHLKQIIKVVK